MDVKFPNLPKEKFDEVVQLSEELGVSFSAAEYILALEEKAERLEAQILLLRDKLDELWEDYRQR